MYVYIHWDKYTQTVTTETPDNDATVEAPEEDCYLGYADREKAITKIEVPDNTDKVYVMVVSESGGGESYHDTYRVCAGANKDKLLKEGRNVLEAELVGNDNVGKEIHKLAKKGYCNNDDYESYYSVGINLSTYKL